MKNLTSLRSINKENLKNITYIDDVQLCRFKYQKCVM